MVSLRHVRRELISRYVNQAFEGLDGIKVDAIYLSKIENCSCRL